MDRKIGLPWLKNQYLQLAELSEGFTYAHWLKLCKLENGRLFVLELLFQMRLLWTQWVFENKTSVDILPLESEELGNGLPPGVERLVNLVFNDYVNTRGLDRFRRDILVRLIRKDIGLSWFKQKLTKRLFENVQPLTEEKWNEFLVDIEGKSIKTERLFQLHLALANLYRFKI